MQDSFSRTRLLLGEERMKCLAACRVAVFGIGGVGGYTVEALARSGIGALDLIDDDRICLSNLNRQLHATLSTVGRYKVDVAAERIRDINPDCAVTTYKTFFLPETQDQFDFSLYDYVVDAIDTVAGKLALVDKARMAGVPVICSMGAGNKLDPTAFHVADIYSTAVCPLARVMRSECRRRGIEHLKVVYSTEMPVKPAEAVQDLREGSSRRQIPGSIAFVPAAAGLILAGEVVKDLSGISLPEKNIQK